MLTLAKLLPQSLDIATKKHNLFPPDEIAKIYDKSESQKNPTTTSVRKVAWAGFFAVIQDGVGGTDLKDKDP